MSNIKIIDGVAVNLDLVKEIDCFCHDDEQFKIKFIFSFDYEFKKKMGHEVVYSSKTYKTIEDAKVRIKEILEKQNNKEAKI